MKNLRFSFLRLAALLALLLAAALSLAADIKILKVDNRDGTAKVTTDAKNATIVVTAVREDGKGVASWTVTTDASGRASVPSGFNLRLGSLKARTAASMPALVAPSQIIEGEVVMVAITGSVSGEVVELKTESGEVVAQARTDKLGRIVLPALAAGVFSLVQQGGNTHSLRVGPRPQGAFVQPSGNLPRAIGSPLSVPLSAPLTDPTHCTVKLEGPVETATPVLASSSHEAIAAPPQNAGATPGSYRLQVLDADGVVVSASSQTLFEATSQLRQTRIASGTATQLVVTVEPPIAGSVTATVIEGPVRFSNGGQTMSAAVQGGKATFPVVSQPGSAGKFQLAWDFAPEVQASLDDPGEKPPVGTTTDDEKVDAKKVGGSWVIDVTDKKTGVLKRRVIGRHGKVESTESWTPFDPRLGHGVKKTIEDLGGGKSRETTEQTGKDGKTVSGSRETLEGKGKDSKVTKEHWEAGEGGKGGKWVKDK